MTGDGSRAGSTVVTAPLGYFVLNAVVAVIVLAGVSTQLSVIVAYRRGDMHLSEAMLVLAMAAVITAAGLWHFYHRYVVVAARDAAAARTAALHPDAPWMLNSGWAARRLVDRSSRGAAAFLWIWVVGWWAGSALIFGVNRHEILASLHTWSGALLALFFVSCGLLALACAVAMTRKWLRFGATSLSIDTLPGYLGDRFRGTVTAKLPDREPALEAEIACERLTVTWTRTPKGGLRKDILTEPVWSHSWSLEQSRMARGKDGHIIIPIDVALPADQPQVEIDEEGGGVQWMLYLRDKRAGAAAEKPSGPAAPTIGPAELGGFSAEFAIPVYARR